MRDRSGNPLPEAYEYSIEGQMILLLNNIEKAIWILAHADKARRTKDQMHEDIQKATKELLDAKKRIRG